MMDLVDYVGALIRLNDGKVVGKTRLQKIVYLLEMAGVGHKDIDFDYHNYGPFSSELAFAADDAESLGYIKTKEHQGHHAVPYTVFRSTEHAPAFDESELTEERADALTLMNECSALVLEIAATAVYLKNNGYDKTYWDEVKRRKPLKTTEKRKLAAERLIENLGL